MSNVFFTSDWHLDHKNVLNFLSDDGERVRPFTSIDEHNETLLDNYLKVVKPADTVYFLGDVSFSFRGLELIKNLPGNKYLVRGNHDKYSITKYVEVFADVLGIVTYKEFWLSHCPIHPDEMRNRTANIHGHTHHNMIQDHRYFNVCPEVNNFEPIHLDFIRSYYTI